MFHDALERPAGERPAIVEDACNDPEIRREVIALLAAEAGADRRIDGAMADALELASEETMPQSIGPYRIPSSGSRNLDRFLRHVAWRRGRAGSYSTRGDSR